MYAAMPWLGLVLFLATLRPFAQKRTFVTVTNMIAATCCLLAFVLWPDENAIALDRVVHVAGLGHLVGRLTLTLAVVLHTVAVCVSIGVWNRLYKLLQVPTAVCAAIYIYFWVQAHGAHVRDLETLFYYGYHGRPASVLWMSIWRGVTIMWYSSVTVSIYAVVAVRSRGMWRWTSVVTGAAFIGSILLGVVAIEEALADSVRQPSSALLSLSSALLVASCGTIVLVYLLYTNLRPLWLLLRRLHEYPQVEEKLKILQEEEERLLELRQDVRDLNLRVSDELVLLRDWADPNLVSAVKQSCMEQGCSTEDTEISVEAMRLISLNPEHIHLLHRRGEQGFESRDDRALGAQEYADLAEHSLWFYGDVYLVAALGLDAERLGIRFKRPPEERHRRLAAIIQTVLAAYQQPPEYLEAYRADVARRAAARQDFLRSTSPMHPPTGRRPLPWWRRLRAKGVES